MGDRSGLTKLDRTNGFEGANDYMRVKKTKLAQQNDQIREALRHRNSTIRTDIFKGISINVNGRTQPTADELKRLILLNGGDYHPYYRYQTTKFMIATNLSTARVKQLRPDDRIVKPEWITESIQAKCLLPYQDYQLFIEEPRGKTGSVMPISEPSASSLPRLEALPAVNKNASSSTSSQGSQKNHQQQQQSKMVPVAVSYSKSYRNNKSRQKDSHREITKSRDIREMFSKLPEKVYQANLCGLTNIDDVIGLLNEWVGCPEGITDEDTACVTNYFYDLMREKNYHNKFYEIIDALHQRLVQHDETCWTVLYNNLVETLKAELNHNSEASQNLLQLITTIEVEDTKMNEFETSTSKGGGQGESSSLPPIPEDEFE